MDCLHDIDWIFAHVDCTCTTYAEGQWKGEACERFETLWTKYEAIRVPVERYRLDQNNSPPHTASSRLLELDVLEFGRVDHLTYSPYLSPFDIDVYPKVKSQLKGRRFSSHPELRSATANIISQYNQYWSRAIFNKCMKRHRKCIAYNDDYFEKKWQVSDWPSLFNKPTLLTLLIASLACSTSAVVPVFKARKWLHVYHYCSSYRRQIEVFRSVCFIAVCEILHSREKKSTYVLMIPHIYIYPISNIIFTSNNNIKFYVKT